MAWVHKLILNVLVSIDCASELKLARFVRVCVVFTIRKNVKKRSSSETLILFHMAIRTEEEEFLVETTDIYRTSRTH